MVEEFEFTGKTAPTFSELMRAIVNREIPGTEYVPNPPGNEIITRTLAFTNEHGEKAHLVMYANVKFDRSMRPEIIDDKIGFFSRYGSNFEAVGILKAVCDKYGCGYMSYADGVLREPRE